MPETPLFRRPRTYISLLLFSAGLAACAVLWFRLGVEEMRDAIFTLARYIPVLFLLETGRLLAEMRSTRLVLRSAGVIELPLLLLLRGQCLAHACNKLLPTGRLFGEGMKAAILSSHVAPAKALGAGGAAQIMTLLANGTLALCAAIIIMASLGAWREASLFLIYTLVTFSLGGGALLALRSEFLMGMLRRFAWTRKLYERLDEFARSGSRFGINAFLWHTMGKVARVGQYAVMLAVLGDGVKLQLALVAESVQILGGAAGEVVPAQVGAIEGALVLAAPLLGLTGSEALSMGLIVHGTQLLFAGAALLFSLLLKLLPMPKAHA